MSPQAQFLLYLSVGAGDNRGGLQRVRLQLEAADSS